MDIKELLKENKNDEILNFLLECDGGDDITLPLDDGDIWNEFRIYLTKV